MAIMAEKHGAPQPLECIDLASPHKLQQAARVRQACASSGFFYIINHSIDSNLLTEVFAQSKKFFALPMEAKMKVFRTENQRGYTPLEYESLDPGLSSRGDTKECYDYGLTIPGSDVPLYSPNPLPSSELLPGWKETIDRYQQELGKLAKSLASLIAMALNLDESFFDRQGVLENGASVVRLLHYAAEESKIEAGEFAAGAHCDWGFMTLLMTDDVPGLQLCRNKDAVPQVWEDVPPINGAFIVNLGEMLEMWTNGLFRATLHRVIGKGVERYSIPFFFNPDYHCVVECFPTCCSEDHPPKYPPITCGEYLMGRYKESFKSA